MPHSSALGPNSITIRRPDDWHVHLRDGPMLNACAVHTARQFARAIIMPNLVPPVTKVAEAASYRERIRRAVPAELKFEPLMTCYLTDGADPAELLRGRQEGVWVAAKLYPAHATTNSAHGVTSMDRIARGLEAMEKAGMPLLVHGEVTDAEVDIFDREAVFLDKVLAPLLKRHQGLKIVLEHITTKEGVAFVEASGPRVGGTITPHHLSYNRNAIFKGGIRPHLYCLPIAKSEEHRLALRRAATSGKAQFFLGTDTAPHTADTKECACGCAGIFNAPVAMQVYAQVFAEEGALDRLEAFASLNGPRFYGLTPNEERITLRAAPLQAPERIDVPGGNKSVVVFHPDTPVGWSFDTTGVIPSAARDL
ncbi:MAG TPA: dihydroorotase [Reyranella sp.]